MPRQTRRLTLTKNAVLALDDDDRARLQIWMIDDLEPIDFTRESFAVRKIKRDLEKALRTTGRHLPLRERQ
jgi:hypothetical protein